MKTREFDRFAGSPKDGQLADEDWFENVHDGDEALGHGIAESSQVVSGATDSEIRKYYQTLLRELPWPGSDTLQTLAITSCNRGEGVSTTASLLAVVAASIGSHQVLLVDANANHQSLDTKFGLALDLQERGDSQSGLAIQPTRHKNLGLLTVSGPRERLGSAERWSQLVAATKRSYDLVVFDMPVADPSNLSLQVFSSFDGVVLVAEAGRVRHEVADHTKQKLDEVGANLLGIVLNKRKYPVPDWLYRTL